MSDILGVINGKGGKLYLYENKVIIDRNIGCGCGGCLTLGLFGGNRGQKTLYFDQVSSVQIKKSGMFSGYIQFAISGGVENNKGIFSATKDENTVMFDGGNNLKIAQLVEQKLHEYKSLKNIPTVVQKSSHLDELTKLKALFDSQAITFEEYEEQKKKLLK